MTLVDKTFEQMQDEIGFERFVRHDVLSPERTPEKFKEGVTKEGKILLLPNWGYYGGIQDQLHGVDYALGKIPFFLDEVFLNAYERAHGEDGSKDIVLKVGMGDYGYIFRVEDSGEGFDFGDKIRKFNAGENYAQRNGSCLDWLSDSCLEASYEGTGSVVNVKIMKEGLGDDYSNIDIGIPAESKLIEVLS